MQNLTLSKLAEGIVKVRDNAKKAFEDAGILKEAGRISSAYALAYISCEESGKISILLGAATNLAHGAPVDWKTTGKRFRSHQSKASQFLALARTIPFIMETAARGEKTIDTERLFIKALLGVMVGPQLFASRNAAFYCDFDRDAFIRPEDQIDSSMLDSMMEFARQNLKAAEVLAAGSAEDVALRIDGAAKAGRSQTTYTHVENSKALIEDLLSPENKLLIDKALKEAFAKQKA